MDRVICLVEMKRTNAKDAAGQLTSTKEHIKKLLHEECNSLPEKPEKCRPICRKQIEQIVWKAFLYHHCSSQDNIADIQRELKKHGFKEVSCSGDDLRPLLMGTNAKEMAKK